MNLYKAKVLVNFQYLTLWPTQNKKTQTYYSLVLCVEFTSCAIFLVPWMRATQYTVDSCVIYHAFAISCSGIFFSDRSLLLHLHFSSILPFLGCHKTSAKEELLLISGSNLSVTWNCTTTRISDEACKKNHLSHCICKGASYFVTINRLQVILELRQFT